ncbi:hypothetical protein EVAR_92347_1 [Eumeta japonica]|uniref:Uncharacterized protein n=1 Tax=Eumeta variegata TaxID=151549 RepID=A0A4C1TLT8_EUMVA|nr:hypothetical protein EVAR_92347_1 [Eumeta japonica]
MYLLWIGGWSAHHREESSKSPLRFRSARLDHRVDASVTTSIRKYLDTFAVGDVPPRRRRLRSGWCYD